MMIQTKLNVDRTTQCSRNTLVARHSDNAKQGRRKLPAARLNSPAGLHSGTPTTQIGKVKSSLPYGKYNKVIQLKTVGEHIHKSWALYTVGALGLSTLFMLSLNLDSSIGIHRSLAHGTTSEQRLPDLTDEIQKLDIPNDVPPPPMPKSFCKTEVLVQNWSEQHDNDYSLMVMGIDNEDLDLDAPTKNAITSEWSKVIQQCRENSTDTKFLRNLVSTFHEKCIKKHLVKNELKIAILAVLNKAFEKMEKAMISKETKETTTNSKVDDALVKQINDKVNSWAEGKVLYELIRDMPDMNIDKTKYKTHQPMKAWGDSCDEDGKTRVRCEDALFKKSTREIKRKASKMYYKAMRCVHPDTSVELGLATRTERKVITNKLTAAKENMDKMCSDFEDWNVWIEDPLRCMPKLFSISENALSVSNQQKFRNSWRDGKDKFYKQIEKVAEKRCKKLGFLKTKSSHKALIDKYMTGVRCGIEKLKIVKKASQAVTLDEESKQSIYNAFMKMDRGRKDDINTFYNTFAVVIRKRLHATGVSGMPKSKMNEWFLKIKHDQDSLLKAAN